MPASEAPSAMADDLAKRARGSPTRITPVQPSKRSYMLEDSPVMTPGEAGPSSPFTLSLAITPDRPQNTPAPPSVQPPSGARPWRKPLREQVSSRRQLSYLERTLPKREVVVWSVEEQVSLVKFILLWGMEVKWPSSKDVQFWNAAANFIQLNCGTKRTGTLRLLVFHKLATLIGIHTCRWYSSELVALM